MGGAIIMKFVWRGGSLCTYIVLSLLIAKAGPGGILLNQKPDREICSGEKLSGFARLTGGPVSRIESFSF